MRDLRQQIPAQLCSLSSTFCDRHFYTQLFYSANQQQGGPGFSFPSMETEAQGGDNLSNGSLDILKAQGIISNLKLLKTKLLEQFLRLSTIDAWG